MKRDIFAKFREVHAATPSRPSEASSSPSEPLKQQTRAEVATPTPTPVFGPITPPRTNLVKKYGMTNTQLIDRASWRERADGIAKALVRAGRDSDYVSEVLWEILCGRVTVRDPETGRPLEKVTTDELGNNLGTEVMYQFPKPETRLKAAVVMAEHLFGKPTESISEAKSQENARAGKGASKGTIDLQQLPISDSAREVLETEILPALIAAED